MEVEIQTLTEIIERFLDPYLSILILIIDILAGVVIGISAILAFISYLKIVRKRTHEQIIQQESIRLRLARGMLFALDFQIGADILKTVPVTFTNRPCYSFSRCSNSNHIKLVSVKGDRKTWYKKGRLGHYDPDT